MDFILHKKPFIPIHIGCSRELRLPYEAFRILHTDPA
jgi:hypothetical protein